VKNNKGKKKRSQNAPWGVLPATQSGKDIESGNELL
jgi:hypothetical protein